LKKRYLLSHISVASIIANMIEVKDTDKRWIKVVKKLVNVLALNISKKAGH
jgi:hypothetical protein